MHYPQGQPRDELVRSGPPDVPSWLARRGQGLGHQGRLADARLALDPDHCSLAPAEGLDGGTENRKLMLTANPLWGTHRQHAGDYAATPTWSLPGHRHSAIVSRARRLVQLSPVNARHKPTGPSSAAPEVSSTGIGHQPHNHRRACGVSEVA